MKKLIVYTLFFWILLPATSQAMFRKTFNSNNNFPKTDKFFNQQNFHTSTTQHGMFNRWWKKFNGPSADTQNKFTQLRDKFSKIHEENRDRPYYSEDRVCPDDTKNILHIINSVRAKDINKQMGPCDNTFLQTCIGHTSNFPDADAGIITQKLLEKGADIGYNPTDHKRYWWPSADHETPLWQAALSGNAGAYSAMINHSQDIHLSRPYAGKVLKLPYVVAFGLKRLKTMEDYYMAELQKINNGERYGCGYSYSDRAGSGGAGPYSAGKVTYNLNRSAWFKNKFQKIQDRNTHYHSSFEDKNGFTLPANPLEEESLIYKILEERICAFDEYKNGKIHIHKFNSYNSTTASKNGIPRKPVESLDQMYQLLQREEDLSDHEIFGVADNAKINEIKDAYHNLVKIVHPDRHADTNDKKRAELAMKVVNQAFDNLTN